MKFSRIFKNRKKNALRVFNTIMGVQLLEVKPVRGARTIVLYNIIGIPGVAAGRVWRKSFFFPSTRSPPTTRESQENAGGTRDSRPPDNGIGRRPLPRK